MLNVTTVLSLLESELSIIGEDLDFSKAIYNYTHVQVSYKNG